MIGTSYVGGFLFRFVYTKILTILVGCVLFVRYVITVTSVINIPTELVERPVTSRVLEIIKTEEGLVTVWLLF
jgi:hypothetical protein